MLAGQKAARALQYKARQTFPKFRRIAEQAEFKLLLNSRRISNRWLVVYFRKSESCISRLGVVVSKRIDPKASSRNYAKRLIREEFRRAVSPDCALNIVVRVKQKLQREDKGEIRKGLGQLLREVNHAAIVN